MHMCSRYNETYSLQSLKYEFLRKFSYISILKFVDHVITRDLT